MYNSKIQQFPNEVIEELKYYVYRLIDPRNGETFYVGKGKGNRVFNHMKAYDRVDHFEEADDKIRIIREIDRAGLEVIHVIHRHGMDEKGALEVEAALIDAYPSASNIVGGQGSNDYGPMHALEIIDKYMSEEANFEHKVLMITINKTVFDQNIYDATRFAWKISKAKSEKVEYVLAVMQGIIIGVFVPTEWKAATLDNFPEFNFEEPKRIGFVGHEADSSIKELYLRKRVPVKYRKKGAANPIKYNF
ncbi:hypothetical protein ADIAL_2104 [Alkalibacterium sp. AK22]|uniref:LEM-3-like GIY-YIG domain-containing protein n=1 Tax=Alkalibacterium sp. AK22 TaxID=1229520 RepID=UPI00044C8AA4|nr:hypothetical protein [Alkalibacterium sp. AK22]EXJ22518.1 hypothetical protein ADIAL_2104 [Alkalibacterium sp. AK22]